jgi:benzoyl-CoA 2,3-dioxygenase component B
MLTEEAHHMFVGETGVMRVIDRAAELLKESKGVAEDVRAAGGIDLPTIQKHLNLWFSLSLDLFGSEVSSNAASYFATGLKGRAKEAEYEDHRALEQAYPVERVGEDGKLFTEEVAMRNALNEVLRDTYIKDCQRGCDRWNKALAGHGLSDRLSLPHRRFHRHIGIYADHRFDPQGNPISQEEWDRRKDEWIPSKSDREYIESIQASSIFEPGKMANWIAPPRRGINGMPVDFEYVRTEA